MTTQCVSKLSRRCCNGATTKVSSSRALATTENRKREREKGERRERERERREREGREKGERRERERERDGDAENYCIGYGKTLDWTFNRFVLLHGNRVVCACILVANLTEDGLIHSALLFGIHGGCS